jgi:opacity protein-like surface antigen
MKFIIMILMLSIAAPAFAENDFLEVGADIMFYDEFVGATDLSNNIGVNARWGTLGNTGLYAWGSYEQPDVMYFGDDISRVRTWGLGGGLRVPFNDRIYAFTELGYYFPSSNSGGVDVDYSGDLGGAIGLGYDITNNFTVNTKYRILRIDAKSSGIRTVADMSAFALGLSYRF